VGRGGVRWSRKQVPRKTSKPEYLYKYIPLRAPADKPEKQAQLDALLTTSQLWLAAPSTFNDPLDCKPGFRFGGGTPEERARFHRIVVFRKVKRDHPQAQPEDIPNLIAQYMQIHHTINTKFEEMACDLLSEDLQNVGVLCLSERGRDPVMFYHYGAKHAGMCLKFRVGGLLTGVLPVKYSENYPVVEYFDDSDLDEQYKNIFLTKYKSWEYEHEWRLVNTELEVSNPQRLSDYASELLCGVIFDYKMPQEDQHYAVDLLSRRASQVELFEARLNRNHYLLDIVPYTPGN
jgi:hypothetical protein